jgi:hypothetical protein
VQRFFSKRCGMAGFCGAHHLSMRARTRRRHHTIDGYCDNQFSAMMLRADDDSGHAPPAPVYSSVR